MLVRELASSGVGALDETFGRCDQVIDGGDEGAVVASPGASRGVIRDPPPSETSDLVHACLVLAHL